MQKTVFHSKHVIKNKIFIERYEFAMSMHRFSFPSRFLCSIENILIDLLCKILLWLVVQLLNEYDLADIKMFLYSTAKFH